MDAKAGTLDPATLIHRLCLFRVFFILLLHCTHSAIKIPAQAMHAEQKLDATEYLTIKLNYTNSQPRACTYTQTKFGQCWKSCMEDAN